MQEEIGFNEAGAKSAGKLRLRPSVVVGEAGASMRPAQKAPENRAGVGTHDTRLSGFNEAGAKSAGKREEERKVAIIERRLQ